MRVTSFKKLNENYLAVILAFVLFFLLFLLKSKEGKNTVKTSVSNSSIEQVSLKK
jgi:hypothetical protein